MYCSLIVPGLGGGRRAEEAGIPAWLKRVVIVMRKKTRERTERAEQRVAARQVTWA